MLKLGAWLISPLVFLPLAAQESQLLPEKDAVPPPVDLITPVPPPVGGLGLGGAFAFEPPKNLKIDNFGGGKIEGTKIGGVRYSGPGVKITGDNGLEMFSDQAVADFVAKTVTLTGNVTVYQGNIFQRGEKAVYFYETKFLDASELRVSMGPVLMEAGKFRADKRDGKMVFTGEDSGLTTDDEQTPDFWIRSGKTTIYEDDKIVFDNLRLYVRDTPVFWLPYLSQPLDSELGYHFLPGARSQWGPFLLNTYGIMLGGNENAARGAADAPWLLSRWHLDLRAKRGIGTGVDFVDRSSKHASEISGLSLYYLNDLAPQTSRTGVVRDFLNEDRYQIEFKHRLDLALETNDAEWWLDTNLTLLSDEYYLEDFRTDLYRKNPAPDNTIGLFRRTDESLLSVYARLRLNDFYRSDTRLPEAAFDQARAPLFGSPLLHEGSTSLGLIGEKAADPTRRSILNPLLGLTSSDSAAKPLLDQLNGFDRQLAEKILALPLNDPRRAAIRNQLLDSSYARFNTYQELSLPLDIGGILSFTPQAGIGYTRYGAVDGPVGNIDRSTLHIGAEAAAKLTRDYASFQNRALGLDGLKHILQPYAAWSIVSTNDFQNGDPQVDRLTPTTRPRPLDPARFTATDELNSWNTVRLGARNRLITHRDGGSYEWLYADTYFDAFLKDPEGNRDVSNLYNDVRWQPLPWLGVAVETQVPLVSNGSGFTEFNSYVRFLPTPNLQLALGYGMLSGHPVFNDSNRINLQTYYRINEQWGIGSQHTVELDDSTLELQQYSLYRNLGSWAAALGVSSRDNRLQKEYSVIFSLTLKDFPDLTLPLQFNAE